ALARDEKRASFERLHHRESGEGEKSGLICAGRQTNVYRVFRPEDAAVLAEVVARLEDDRAGLLTVGPNGIELAEESEIRRDRAPIRLVEDAVGWRYEEQLLNWKRAAIIGGGHCGTALTRVLADLGYAVTLFDTRADVETFVEDADARQKIVVDDFADAGAHIEHKHITHVIVMTMGQPGDVRGLLGTVEGPYPYVGVMGSRAKLARIRQDLLDEGVERQVIEQIRAPIGLEMTSNTPEEIAISVAAELLRLREELFPHTRPAAVGDGS
ncbi:MAG: XdhC family protein, partial [Myxococcota bacterium]